MSRVRVDWRSLLLASFLVSVLAMAPVQAESGLFGLGTRTFGGAFTWSDEVVYQGWRVQKSAVIGHHRLIDPDDRRKTFGTFEHCLAELDQIKTKEKLAPLPREAVIVLHGLGASRRWMNNLSDFLSEEGDLEIVNVGYPSTMGQIGEHARSLQSVIQHLDGVETVSFVAHSMGNIVIRHTLNDLATLPSAQQPKITYKRFVMIAPPNHGAMAADRFADNKLANLFGGDAVNQLAPSKGWETLERRLATPDFEFGIIVGGTGDDEGYLRGVPGDDDMLLSVETSKLAGARDFVQVKGIHQSLPKDEAVQDYTLRFLETGAFLPSGRRYPINK